MRSRLFVLLVAFLALFASASQLKAEQTAIGAPAPEFNLNNALGNLVSSRSFLGKTVVLEWFNPGCPFVKKFYANTDMQRFQAEARKLGAVWLTINSSAPGKQGHISKDEALTIAKENGLTPESLLLDPEGSVGRSFEAKTTPHIFVIDSKGILAYAGAIDNVPSTRSSDIASASNYAISAVKSLAANQRPNPASTDPYGCSVKY